MSMKFYPYFLFVIFVTLYTKAEPSVYRARNLEQIVPVKYSSRILNFLPFRRCFNIKTNILVNCLNKTRCLQEYFFRHHVNRAQDGSKINFTRKPIPKHDNNQAYEGRKTSHKFNSPIFNKYQMDKLNKKILQRTTKYGHDLPVETEFFFRTRKSGTFETSPGISESTKNLIASLVDADATLKQGDMNNLADSEENFDSVENSIKIPPENITETMENSLRNALEKVLINKNKESISEAESPGNLILRDSVELEKQDILHSEMNNSFTYQNDLVSQNYFEDDLIFALNQFERQLHLTNFMKFLSLTPASKGDSGMSFVQSGLFLEMALMALSTEVDLETKNEIDQNFAFNVSDLDKIELIKQVMSSLPNSSEELKFRWASRLVLRSGRQLSQEFSSGTAEALQLKIEHFEDSLTPEEMAQVLNRMIEEDSGGAIRDTFDEEDLSENEEAVLITTLYFRARWRTAPTLLNGTRLFRDSENAPLRTIKMIRVNDIMKYVDLPEWDAEAIEIPYLTEGLSLLMLVPRGNSLKSLVEHVSGSNLTSITERMQNIRVAASLPLFTLRMTLLLPNKLEAMGIPRIVNVSASEGDSLRITQAVQRIMFWAEAGRNAYKDDGLEWDESPEMKIMIDRPYMFYVRWQKLNLIVGNFVL